MLKTLTSVFLKCSLVIVSVSFTNPVLAQSSPESSSNNGYPADFEPDYLKGCAKDGKSKGFKPEVINSYCSCTLKQLQSKISFERMKEIVAETQKTRKPSAEVQEIFKTCQSQNMPK